MVDVEAGGGIVKVLVAGCEVVVEDVAGAADWKSSKSSSSPALD